jgi:hypothetical protein
VQRDFERRAAVYGFLEAVALVGAIAAMRPRSRRRQRRFFANVGTVGVLLGLLTLFLIDVAERRLPGEIASVQIFLPAITMLGVAALGGLWAAAGASRVAVPAEAPIAAGVLGNASLRRLPWIGVVLTGAAVVLAMSWAAAQPGCNDPGREPSSSDLVLQLAMLVMLGAVAFGVLGLVARRWLLALICLATSPVALILAAFTQSCG